MACSRLFVGTALLGVAVTTPSADTTKYTYDALGRLTFVEDSANGNRDYDYDAAGNRLLVTTGADSDAANDPGTAAPSAPAALSYPASSTTGSYLVSWGEAAGRITSYELWEATNASFSGEARVYSGSLRTHSVSGRGDGTYYYRVRACNAANCGAYRSGTSAISVLLPPGMPGGMNIPSLAIPPNNYLVTWGASSGAVASYEFEQHANATFTAPVLNRSTAATSTTLTASAEGMFYFRVRACNASSCSTYRSGANGVQILGPPGMPTGLRSQLVSYCTWGAFWDEVPGATSYKVTDTRGVVSTTSHPRASIVWSSPCPPPAGVQPDDNKPMYLQACNAAGCSANASFNSQATPPPGPPGNIDYPLSSSSGSYTVSWGSSPSVVTTYELYEATNVSFSGASRIYNGSGFSIALSRSDGTYYYRVRACNGANCSGHTTGSGITVTLPSGTPGAMSIPSSGVVNTGYVISWGPASGTISRYEIEQHSTPSFTALVQSWHAPSTSLSLTPQSHGSFYFRVRACNISGCSGYTNGANGISIAGPPAMPTGLRTQQVSYCTWGAFWDEVPGATSYKVTDTRGVVSTTSHPRASIVWSSPCPPPAGVTPDSNKPKWVQACNSAGCSANASF